MTRLPLISLSLVWTLSGCAPRGGVQASHTLAPWLLGDGRRCLLTRDLREGMEAMAQRCAEEFVRQNGYTDLPPIEDSTRWVRERHEVATWPAIFAARGGSLAREAEAVQCSARQCIVFFRRQRDVLTCSYRAVTMSQVFTQIEVRPGGVQDIRCRDRQA